MYAWKKTLLLALNGIEEEEDLYSESGCKRFNIDDNTNGAEN